MMEQSCEHKQDVTTRRKRNHTKSRGGCITCKIRRKKCDETRPNCLRCTNTGRKCDGYAPSNLEGFDTSDCCQKAGTGSADYNFPALESPTLLDYFRQQIIPGLSSYYNSTLWQNIFAQTCVSSLNFGSAAVALGAAYHERENGNSSVRKTERGALSIYASAISKIRQILACISTSHAVWMGFILAFMLAAVEILMSNPDAAIMHLTNGLKIAFSLEHDVILYQSALQSNFIFTSEVVAFIQKLETGLSKSLGHHREGNHFGQYGVERNCFKQAYAELRTYIGRVIVLVDTTYDRPYETEFLLIRLDAWNTRLTQLVPRNIEHMLHEFQLLKLYREAAYLLLVVKLHFDHDYSQQSTNDRCNCLLELKAYFSKLLMLASHINTNRNFVAHLTPAQIKQVAAKYGLLARTGHSAGPSERSVPSLCDTIERLVMLESDAIRSSGLVPEEALCMDITSALEEGSVSIRYCIVDVNGVFVWIEKRAQICKPVIIKQQTMK